MRKPGPLFDGNWFSFSQLKNVMGLLNLLGVLSDPGIFAKTWEGAGPWHSIQQWNYFSFPGRINALVCEKCQIKRLSQNACTLKILCELVQAIQRAAELCKPVQLSAARPPWQSRQSWKSWKYQQYRQSCIIDNMKNLDNLNNLDNLYNISNNDNLDNLSKYRHQYDIK